jgi:hypothetical protein
MNFQRDVFISYAHLDNEGGANPGWITRFHNTLDGFLSQRLGHKAQIWRDERLRGNDIFGEEIVAQLPETAVMLSVVSPRYVESDWCLREAATFCEVAQRPPGLTINRKSRVFKIVKMPPDSEAPLPAPMRDTLTFNFYVHSKDGKVDSGDQADPVYELDGCFSDELAKKFNVEVVRLASDICTMLRMLENAGAAQAVAAQRPRVYLAECSYDRRADREALRSELEMHGYPVLPDLALPQDETECRKEVGRLLERCALAVHLVGRALGAVPDGPSEKSVAVIQNELAVERARNAALRRVVSLPTGTQSSEPKQQEFIDAMHNNADVQFGADLITADLESVKAAVREALAQIEAPPVAPGPAAEADATNEKPMLYVIYDESDLQATGDLRDVLENHFKVLKPAFGGTAEEVRQANVERLTRCDAVLIYYGSGTDMWMDSVSSEVDKAAALRPGRPLLAVFNWLAGPPTDDKNDRIRKPRPNVINALSGFSESLVEPIIKTLLGPNHG